MKTWKRVWPTILLAFIFLFYGGGDSATCPYCGESAPATGNTKTVYTSSGPHQSCEYAHAVNIQDARDGKHVFWQICD
jgi:hypothetical protein